MVARHRDLAITREAQARFVSLMSLAADDAGLPADPEFRSALLAYVEWGRGSPSPTHSRARMSRSTPPMPRWGWGEAPPYQP